ncbi:IS3 family transposase [Lacrimispora sp. BS-2]
MSKYIDYYNNQRIQRKLSVMSPMEYHQKYLLTA